ncbi:hypothetical protein [Paucisalibacillus globulus]|uniref:hypothetical protein n=1 Tax=Paucisalibacillus globulus TaxID=351095 RepID=UPI0003F95904|nr:hypothetical protein [Paucisalibacillus globulus]
MNDRVLQEKITLLNNQTKAYANEIKTIIKEQHNRQNNASIIGYFTFSISTTNKKNEKNIILGDFHIKNLSANTINNLYLCIKIDATDKYNFSGKYKTTKLQNDRTASSSYWSLFTVPDKEDENEYWFQLSNQKQLLPHETLSFSDFQINWTNKDVYSCSVQGFIYTDFEKEGIFALNNVNVSIG